MKFRLAPFAVALPAVAVWLTLSVAFILRTPNPYFIHDLPHHIQYNVLLAKTGQIPPPGAGWETHQPPLYYLITSRLTPPNHVQKVRLLSALLGGFVIVLLYRSLAALRIPKWPLHLTVFFLITTPHFLLFFTAYNNDVFAIFFAMAFWALWLKWRLQPTDKAAALLTVVSVAGFFSKLSFGAAWVSACLASLYLFKRKELSPRSLKVFLGSQMLALTAIGGWLWLHNVRHSGEWQVLQRSDMERQRLPRSALSTVLTPPGFTHEEWATPFAGMHQPVGKKNSLIAYAWVTSIFGEYKLSELGDFWTWLLFWIQTAWLAAALLQIPRTPVSQLMGLCIGVAWLALIIYVLYAPTGPAMDFRHVAWVWLPLTVLRGQSLERLTASGELTQRRIPVLVALIGIGVQVALIAAMRG